MTTTPMVRVFAASCALLLSACTASSADAQLGENSAATDTPASSAGTTLGLTYIPNVQFAPTYIAHDEGMYFSAGAKLSLRHHGSDEGLFTALLTGDEDVVLASGDEVLTARSQGMDLVSIATYYQQYPVVILVPENSDIRSIEDLRGRKIGVPGEYGSSWLGLQAILDSSGMTTQDVQVASIGYTQLAALSAGEVDAVVGFSNNELVRFPAAGLPVRALKTGELPMVSASLVTTRENLEKYEQKVCAIALGTQAGMRRSVEVPQRAIEATQERDETLNTPEAVGAARDVLDATSELFKDAEGKVTARPDLKRWESMLTFMSTTLGVDLHGATVQDVVTDQCWK